jgi:HAD superfamily hydrolase (TIGR01456 family)
MNSMNASYLRKIKIQVQDANNNISLSNVNPGVFIDIDGVVLHGGKPFEFSKEAIHTLWNNNMPFVFVTNGTYCSATLCNTLTKILGLPFTDDHVVVAPSPCAALSDYHDKRVLVCCQDDSINLIPELGFTNYMTIPELVEIFPELDYIDHNKRIELLNNPMNNARQRAQDDFKPIETILLLGEPINWECALQILIDVLMVNGDPRSKFKFVPNPHLPIIACNKDLTFKGAAALPRFGHGAFLECLESLYMKVTKNELVYEQMMGKPYLVTYEYAANKIQRQSKNGARINKFYIIGDNPDVDIRGANIYKDYLLDIENKISKSRRSSLSDGRLLQVPQQSNSPSPVESILVCTGVYNPQNDILFHLQNLFQHTSLSDMNNNANDSYESNRISRENSLRSLRNESNTSKSELEVRDLQMALSRKNSFISYFDNKLNIPDLTFDNALLAIEHIVKKYDVKFY